MCKHRGKKETKWEPSQFKTKTAFIAFIAGMMMISSVPSVPACLDMLFFCAKELHGGLKTIKITEPHCCTE